MVRIQVLKHLPGARKSKRGGSKGDVKRRATANGAMEKGVSGSLRGRRSEEMTQSNTSSSRGSEVHLESQRGSWQLKSSRMKRFLEEGRMEEEKESVLPSVGEEQIWGGVHIKKWLRRGVVRRDVDPYIITVGIERRKKEVESSEENRPGLTKRMTPPLANVGSGEKMPGREWLRSERREENPGIRKKGRRVEIGFLDTDKVNRMRREKVK